MSVIKSELRHGRHTIVPYRPRNALVASASGGNPAGRQHLLLVYLLKVLFGTRWWKVNGSARAQSSQVPTRRSPSPSSSSSSSSITEASGTT